jgi:hypothetical protein
MQISTFLDARRRSDLAQDPDYKPRALAHYTELAHQARKLTPSFDRAAGVHPGLCGDLRESIEDDDELTEDDARDQATDQILSYAESVADWLAKACDTDAGRQPLDVRALEPQQIIEGEPAMLLTVLMNGDQKQAQQALFRLRELAAKNFAREINERTVELMREVV